MDVENGQEKVNIDADMARRMWKAAGHDVEIHVSLDRKEALKDADFVTTQISCRISGSPYQGRENPFILWHVRAGNQWSPAVSLRLFEPYL